MKCLRCGYCCTYCWVIIVDDPALGIREDNLIEKRTGERCKHLRGNLPGISTCGIHDRRWYTKTPCYAHTQIERRDQPCRMGTYIRAKNKMEKEQVTR